MTTMPLPRPAWLTGASVLLFAVTLGAQGLRHLPPDGLAIPQSPDSPGRVVFNHSMHVDEGRPDCTTCHPRPFRMLEGRTRATPITHERMDKGELCGKCHDGKSAFALDEDCTYCHTEDAPPASF
jgi:c(7)-type cytochrome triheme protein